MNAVQRVEIERALEAVKRIGFGLGAPYPGRAVPAAAPGNAFALDLRGADARNIGDFAAETIAPLATRTNGRRDLAVNGRRVVFRNGRY